MLQLSWDWPAGYASILQTIKDHRRRTRSPLELVGGAQPFTTTNGFSFATGFASPARTTTSITSATSL